MRRAGPQSRPDGEHSFANTRSTTSTSTRDRGSSARLPTNSISCRKFSVYRGPLSASHRSRENCAVIPVAQQQRDFDIETVIADPSAATFDRTAHAIFDGIGVQMKLFGGIFEATAGAQRDTACFA